MDKVTAIYEQLNLLITDFQTNHDKFVNGNKSAGAKARKALGEIKKLTTAYRQASVEAVKK